MVKWTRHALTQLRHIHDYIAQDLPLYAKRVADALVHKTVLLNELPGLGRKVPEFNEENVRELALYSYHILYEIKTTHIDILAVIHKKKGFADRGDSAPAVALLMGTDNVPTATGAEVRPDCQGHGAIVICNQVNKLVASHR